VEPRKKIIRAIRPPDGRDVLRTAFSIPGWFGAVGKEFLEAGGEPLVIGYSPRSLEPSEIEDFFAKIFSPNCPAIRPARSK
jgi:hypothetical protein